ncbi:MAG: 1-acyl-sn-glycerol-3-phosphate acyltransferase [Spirochaetia bacterium]|nr:1-acyl-sn-glycerol-3-phosphate acyltransferase [Spirochaetia bacterium]
MIEGNSYISAAKPASIGGKLPFLKKFFFYKEFIKKLFRTRRAVIRGEGMAPVIKGSCEVIELCESVGGRIEITGLDNLRSVPGGVVVAANHQSTLETLLFPTIMDNLKPVTFVVKKSLVTGWAFGPIMRLFNPIALDRKEPKVDLEKVMKEGTSALQEGKSVVLFPQGTRCKGFDPATFNSLAVKLAKRAGVPVVPCAVKTDFWENGRLVSTIGDIYPDRTIHMAFGPAITIDGAGKKEQRQLLEYIDETYRGMA